MKLPLFCHPYARMLMRITLMHLLLTGFVLNITYAEPVLAQTLLDQQVTLSIDNKEVSSILSAIEKQANVTFSYLPQQIQASRRVSLTVSNQKLATVLDQLFTYLPVSYEVVGKKQILLSLRPPVQPSTPEKFQKMVQVNFPQPADLSLSGTVRSETGDGLPGVSVVVKGTTRGTTTDADGKYRLTVPDGTTTLVFSFVGYLNQEVAIGNRTLIDVQLRPDQKSLEEVVVVGYGSVKKSDLTGSVASVKAEQLTAYPSINAVQALQGRAAGVQIQANNGEPGASFKVRIRGANSINASSDPIFVVDGFVGGTMPPPEDIESVEVLKDASATAIYGSRGANGVVMVTTKRGKSGKARIELNTSLSSQNEINRLSLLNADQFVTYIKEVKPDYVSRGQNTDWQDQIFQRGALQNYQLSLSGGTDNVKYYVSGAYFDQKGVVINSDFSRFSITSNVDIKATEKLRVGLNVFAQRNTKNGILSQESSGGTNSSGVVSSAFKFGPDLGVYDQNGNFTIAVLNDPINNPYAIATQYQNNNVTDQTQGNLFAEYQILKDLRFRATLGATTNSGRTGTYTPTTLNAGASVGGAGSMSGSRNTLFQSENYFSYDKTLGEAHRVGAMAGFSYQSSRSENWSGSGQSFISDALSYWNLGSSSVWQSPTSSLTDWKLASWYGRVNYAFHDRYLLTVNARYDGSSTFSRNHKWAFFPSGAFA